MSVIPSGRAIAPTAAAVGALAAAAASICAFHVLRRKRPPATDDGEPHTSSGSGSGATSDEDHYRRLGISEENLPPHIRREIHKARKRKAKVEMISMKTKMYDNVMMLDREGGPMCTISLKKARWYVNKGIAEWSSPKQSAIGNGSTPPENNKEEEVQCIRLLFEHNGANTTDRDASETLYLRSAKQNVCVACGNDGHHMRHYIVPYAYRTLLPEAYKSHMSHDIVILCPDCHVECERHSKRRMKRMEHDLRTKTGGDALDVSPVLEDPQLYHVRSCAIALVQWKDRMPTEKVERYERDVREYLASVCTNEDERSTILTKEAELTKAQLQRACGVNYRVKNPNYVPGSELVVHSLTDAKSIEEFIRGWREHFLTTVDPIHMPAGWRVDNPVVCGSSKDDDKSGDVDVRTW